MSNKFDICSLNFYCSPVEISMEYGQNSQALTSVQMMRVILRLVRDNNILPSSDSACWVVPS